MKRDFDLIREILLEVEAKSKDTVITGMSIDGYINENIAYHIELLLNSGFLEGKLTRTKSGDLLRIQRMSYIGHDLLDNIRDKGFFEKLKKHTKDKGVPLTFDTIKAAVPMLVQSLLGS